MIKKRINRQIEEGVYNMDNDEFVPFSSDGPRVRNSSIVEIHNDLDKVDEDEFDRILDQEKAMKRNKSQVERQIKNRPSVRHIVELAERKHEAQKSITIKKDGKLIQLNR